VEVQQTAGVLPRQREVVEPQSQPDNQKTTGVADNKKTEQLPKNDLLRRIKTLTKLTLQNTLGYLTSKK
jgi:hypothetical protein